jgi:hypothetical protein
MLQENRPYAFDAHAWFWLVERGPQISFRLYGVLLEEIPCLFTLFSEGTARLTRTMTVPPGTKPFLGMPAQIS